MKTLRRRVAVTLLLTILVACLTVSFLRYREFTRAETGLLDMDLRDSAKRALLSLPTGLLAASAAEEGRFELPSSNPFHGNTVIFQIWSLPDKRMLLKSPGAPPAVLAKNFQNGFGDTSIQGERWRVYAVSDVAGRVQVQLAKSESQLRAEGIDHLRSGLDVLIAVFLLLTMATWLVIRRAFRPVDRAREAISRRTDMDLTPLPTLGMPGELQPFIESINQLLVRLAASLDRERRFLADAAHELRTPLAALSAYAELASSSGAGQVREQAVEQLRVVAARTARVAEQLLEQARMEALGEIPSERVALDRLVEMIVRDSEVIAAKKGQRILLDVQPAYVTGKLDAIGVLLRNLLDNALRYTPKGGKISVECRVLENESIQLTVADNGPGIAQVERERVFDRFYRVPGSTESGSGIGLSLVANIAAMHKAKIYWSPGLDGRGVGITVTFAAPAA